MGGMGGGMMQAGIGASVQTTMGLFKALVQKKLAKEQMERSKKLREEAYAVKKPELQQEFRDVERMKALGILTGMPGYAGYNAEIEQSGATALRTGQEGAGSAGEYLQYASNIYESENKAKRDLKAQDTGYRAGAASDYATTIWQIGNEELKNKMIQKEERDRLLGQAGALENASTANKYGAADTALSSAGEAAGTFAGSAGGGGGKGNSFFQPQQGTTTPNNTDSTRFQKNESGLAFNKTTPTTEGSGVQMVNDAGNVINVPNDYNLIMSYMQAGYKMVGGKMKS